MSDRPVTLDGKSVTRLTQDIGAVIKAHYEGRPTDRNTVFEVLNALGYSAGLVLSVTKGDEAVRHWFDACVDQATTAGAGR